MRVCGAPLPPFGSRPEPSSTTPDSRALLASSSVPGISPSRLGRFRVSVDRTHARTARSEARPIRRQQRAANAESGPLSLPSATRASLGAATPFGAEHGVAKTTEDRSFHSRLRAASGYAKRPRFTENVGPAYSRSPMVTWRLPDGRRAIESTGRISTVTPAPNALRSSECNRF